MSSFVTGLVKKVWSSSVGGALLDGFRESEDEDAPRPVQHACYMLKTAFRTTDYAKSTLFVCGESPIRESEWVFVRSSLKRLKTLRHPHIVKFLHSKESSKSSLIFATESVLPIGCIDDWSAEEVVAGLWNVLNVLSFMHEKCSIFHGSIGPHSVFATAAREMKVGLFDVAAEKTQENATYFNNLRSSSSLKMLENMFESVAVKSFTKEAIDALLLCKLFFGILSGSSVSRDRPFVEEFTAFLKKMDQESRRKTFLFSTQLDVLKRSSLAKNYGRLLDVCRFFDEYAVKGTAEKDIFLTRLAEDCGQQPVPSTAFLMYRVLPTVVASLSGCGLRVLPRADCGSLLASEVYTFLRLATMLPAAEYENGALPLIVALFSVLDRGVRLMLLESVELHMPLIPKSTLNDKIYPLLVSGFNDGHPLVREQTLKAIVTVAPKLKTKLLNGDVLRFIARLQTDPHAGIRINATVSLGRISGHLEAAVAKKVLLAGFTRVLTDAHYQCRMAGVKALVATAHIFDVEEVCVKIVPAIAPLIVDDSREVRELCIDAFETFWATAKRYATALHKDIVVSAGEDFAEGKSRGDLRLSQPNASSSSAPDELHVAAKRLEEDSSCHSTPDIGRGLRSLKLKSSRSAVSQQKALEREVLDGWGDDDEDDLFGEEEAVLHDDSRSSSSSFGKRMSLRINSPRDDFNPWQ